MAANRSNLARSKHGKRIIPTKPDPRKIQGIRDRNARGYAKIMALCERAAGSKVKEGV